MLQNERPTNAERKQTDESLRAEREMADLTLEQLADIDDTADAVIALARARADAVLAAVRAKTDDQQIVPPRGARVTDVVARERLTADRVLKEERADADAALQEEREEHLAVLSSEREDTDKGLLQERAQSDDALAARDEFMGIVSHDLRNLLSAVVTFAALIERCAAQPERADEVILHARRIQRGGGRMNRLIGDLVDVASIEAGRLIVTLEPSDPRQVVNEAVDTLHARALANGITLTAEVGAAPALVWLDPARILQVLTNLLSNAIKFTPEGGRVLVRAEQEADEVSFAVEDSGIGIPAEHLDRIFGRFSQVEKDDRRGLGLGLFISRCIVEGHGGRIWAESKLGRGSAFHVTLPIQAAA